MTRTSLEDTSEHSVSQMSIWIYIIVVIAVSLLLMGILFLIQSLESTSHYWTRDSRKLSNSNEAVKSPRITTGSTLTNFDYPQPFLETSDSLLWQEFSMEFANNVYCYRMTKPPRSDICQRVTLFAFIPTRPEDSFLRSAIRQTWAKIEAYDILIRFIIGRSRSNGKLLDEHLAYDDIIFYDIEDTYRNLYFKIYAAFQWQNSFCSNAKFVLKIDDDTIVDIPRLKFWINRKMAPLAKKHPAIIFGHLNQRMRPIRDKRSRYFVSHSLYSPEVFPPYMSGPSYVLSNEAVSAILKHSYKVKAFEIEDALYTGVIADVAGIHRENMRKQFRTLGQVKFQEECDKETKVPILLATHGSTNVNALQRTFASLKNISC